MSQNISLACLLTYSVCLSAACCLYIAYLFTYLSKPMCLSIYQKRLTKCYHENINNGFMII